MSTLLQGSLGSIISARSAALVELQKKLDATTDQSKKLRAELLETAPQKIQNWLDKEGMLTVLLQYGKASFEISFNENGFGGVEATKKIIGELKKAWKGVVHIELQKPEPHRIAIEFSAVM